MCRLLFSISFVSDQIQSWLHFALNLRLSSLYQRVLVLVLLYFYLFSYVSRFLRLDSGSASHLFLANLSCLLATIMVSHFIQVLSFFISPVPIGLSAWYQS